MKKCTGMEEILKKFRNEKSHALSVGRIGQCFVTMVFALTIFGGCMKTAGIPEKDTSAVAAVSEIREVISKDYLSNSSESAVTVESYAAPVIVNLSSEKKPEAEAVSSNETAFADEDTMAQKMEVMYLDASDTDTEDEINSEEEARAHQEKESESADSVSEAGASSEEQADTVQDAAADTDVLNADTEAGSDSAGAVQVSADTADITASLKSTVSSVSDDSSASVSGNTSVQVSVSQQDIAVTTQAAAAQTAVQAAAQTAVQAAAVQATQAAAVQATQAAAVQAAQAAIQPDPASVQDTSAQEDQTDNSAAADASVSADVSQAADVQDTQDAEDATAPAALEAVSAVPAGISAEDYDALCRIVQAEASGESQEGKLLVADVVLNRVADPNFPGTIQGVITQSGQFSPVANGSYGSAVPSADTVAAVNRALSGENISQGALYFKSVRSGSDWGARTMLFNYGNHNFYM